MLFKKLFLTSCICVTVITMPTYAPPGLDISAWWSEITSSSQVSATHTAPANGVIFGEYSATPMVIPTKVSRPTGYLNSSHRKPKRHDKPSQIFIYALVGTTMSAIFLCVFIIMERITLPECAMIMEESKARGESIFKMGLKVLSCWKISVMLLSGVLGFPCVVVYYIVRGFYLIHRYLKKRNYIRNKSGTSNSNNISENDKEIHNKVVTRSEIEKYVPRYHSEEEMEIEFFMPKDGYCQKMTYGDLVRGENEIAIRGTKECIICLEEYEDKQRIVVLPCEHYFHHECLLEARKSQIREMRYSDQSLRFRCPLCQLNLLRHYLYYLEHDLDPKKVRFANKE